jgi:hypothetical protein
MRELEDEKARESGLFLLLGNVKIQYDPLV